jgi:hypothetical protein
MENYFRKSSSEQPVLPECHPYCITFILQQRLQHITDGISIAPEIAVENNLKALD